MTFPSDPDDEIERADEDLWGDCLKRNAALSTESQKRDGCLAFVDPPCEHAAVRHHLCMGHMDGYEGTNWQRVEYIGFDGKVHSYIALDAIPPSWEGLDDVLIASGKRSVASLADPKAWLAGLEVARGRGWGTSR